jgi:hypothetical protein
LLNNISMINLFKIILNVNYSNIILINLNYYLLLLILKIK